MAKKLYPTLDTLRQLMEYNPGTGELRWKPRTPDMFRPGRTSSEANCAAWNRRYAGQLLGNGVKRHQVKVEGRQHIVHRLAWLLHYGTWPINELDHINGDPSDNRIVNLREATKAQNGWNRGPMAKNKLGVKGISYVAKHKFYIAQMTVNSKKIYIGSFKSLDEAKAAYEKASKLYHGEFARIA
jgi:hypothetical protein